MCKDTESVHDDDEEDVDEINLTQVPKEVVRAHSPNIRVRGADVCQYMRRIDKYNVSARGIKPSTTYLFEK